MRSIHPVLIVAALPLLCGCAGLQRPLTDAALGAGGAYLGNTLSHGNALATAGGAAGGVLLGEGFQALKTGSEKRAYGQGYTQGRSDGVKQLYWNLQDRQRERAPAETYRLYPVTIPAHYEDGVLVQPTQRALRINE
jgi:hypothetical protein